MANRGYFVEFMQRTYNPRVLVVPYTHLDLHGVRGQKVRRTHEVDITAWLEFRDKVRDYLAELPYGLPLVAAA